MNASLGEAKDITVRLVQQLSPSEVEAIEDGFDGLVAVDFKPPATVPEHAFHIPPEVWSYAQTIGTFVGGIIAGAAKDVIKDRLAKLILRLDKPSDSLTDAEIDELVAAVEPEGKSLGIPRSHRKRLQEDLHLFLKEHHGKLPHPRA